MKKQNETLKFKLEKLHDELNILKSLCLHNNKKICIRILKKEFPKCKFITTKLEWPNNDISGRLPDLDLYSKKLKLAVWFCGDRELVEYNYKLEKQMKQICSRYSIYLLVIPNCENIDEYIKLEIDKYRRIK